jgi:hypothetical protein
MNLDDVKKVIQEFISNPEYKDGFINQQYTREMVSLYEKMLANINVMEKDETIKLEEVLEISNKDRKSVV